MNKHQTVLNRIQNINGVPTINGNVYLSGKNLTKLPNLSNVTVTGSFDCSNNNLTSLQGAPKFVGGYVYCFNNKLTSLQGSLDLLVVIFIVITFLMQTTDIT
jgi:hypothetical protein